MNAHASHPRLRRTGLYALVAVVLATVLVPFGWMVLSSFKTPAEIRGLTDSWLPGGLYLGNYQGLQDTSFVTYFVNSMVIAVGTTSIAILIAVLAGYGLARFNFVGNRMLLIAIVTMQMFPAVLLAVPLYKMLSTAQLLDTRVGLVVVYTTFAMPFCIWMLRNYFLTVPVEVEESAMIDGCNRLTALWRVVLPPTMPAVAAAAAFCVIQVWEEFLYANTFIDSDELRPLSVGLNSLIGQYSTEWGRLMAAGVLMVIPVVLIFAFLQRFLTQLAGGSVKG
ncbi:carbohydrate ABC transporter membrane protein 2 (CUT1 family) [Haloactinopolyspora alba]|uniref:Carbohydrate ABC transporter membrane protein 2 (CUT1 family) n=1 Tax=Haloactinopolyspora alba TaxID=648780 RepID=A0A2P8DVQ6_9ACTN|nr:carbohydrate ABC transporter permease [Haloactinopolyspora alba]PSL01285.1 carbohydrate ABC transporter membrane protein 2 (CUT1 family) [Haloactinopolyspora alba]